MSIIDLATHRPPVCYTLRIAHYHTGEIEASVEDIADTPEAREAVANAFARLSSAWLNPRHVHQIMLDMISERMGATKEQPQQIEELDALVDACAAYEKKRFKP